MNRSGTNTATVSVAAGSLTMNGANLFSGGTSIATGASLMRGGRTMREGTAVKPAFSSSFTPRG